VSRTASTNQPLSPVETLEADAADAGLAAGEALRAVEVAGAVFLGLLICPPLAILAVIVVVPLLVMALVIGLLVAVVSVPYLLVHHFRSHDRRHLTLLAHRLRGAGRAILDLAPHRIVADARKAAPGR
jgi:Flp pilus assembly protein TadB